MLSSSRLPILQRFDAKLTGLMVGALPILAASPGAASQPAAFQPSSEIVITGERVARTRADTASSVFVVTSDEIARLAKGDRLEQLLALTPNIQLGTGGEGPAIRGQDSTGPVQNLFAFLGGTRPRVTLQIDGRPLGYNELIYGNGPLWDVRQVEIFRTPQTTTQGRNAIAGAIFMETENPTMDLAAAARLQAGSNAFRQVSGMISGPLAADELAIRLVGDVRRGRPSSDLADVIPSADINRDDFSLLRAKILLQPSTLPGVRLLTTYVHLETQTPQFDTAAYPPFEERQVGEFERTNGIGRLNVDSLTARLDASLKPGLDWSTTLAFGDVLVRRFSQPGLGINRIESTELYLESRLAFGAGDRRQSIIGASWFGQNQKQTTDLAGLGLGTGGFDDRQSSFGLFGETSFRPADAFTITAGLRYQRDQQDRQGQVGVPPAGAIISYNKTFDAWLPKLVVAWRPRPEATVGVLVQRAYNPGGTSLSLSQRRQTDFDAETLWNYELFFRDSFDDGRWTVDANLFWLDMFDNQRAQTVPILLPDGSTLFASQTSNAPRASSAGLEAGLSFNPGPRFRARAGIGLLKTRIRETLLPTDPVLGKEFQRAPRFTGSAAIDWQPIPSLALSTQMRGWSGYFSNDANSPALRIDGGAVVDSRLAWKSGPFTASLFVRNIFDHFYLTYLFPKMPLSPQLATLGEPREVGIGLEARF